MERSDLGGVASLEAACFPVPWSPALFREALEDPRHRSTIARLGRTTVGYLVAWFAPSEPGRDSEEVHVLNLAVDPGRRRRGIARRLLVDLLEEARARGVRSVTLEVRPSNAAALGLYRGLGFVRCGVRRGYYSDTHEDAWIFTRPLAPGAPGAELP